MCVDYTGLNKACQKDPFPFPRINQIIDLTVGCELLSFLDAYSGYHQIPLTEADQPATTFITPLGCFCSVKNVVRIKERGGHLPMVYTVLFQSANRAQPGGICRRCRHEDPIE
jgi:hypothetical protein